ncbi:MAG TPA: response regulator [Chloroflexi bacterium]|nr:response regulator [Chloroflexota bacterium]
MARVLVADDEPEIRRIIGIFLRRVGHEIVEADDGMSAMALMEELRPDAAVVDVVMPGMTGIELTRTIRSVPHLAPTPIIMLSARTLPHEVEEGMKLGANMYLSKPFSPSTLIAAVNRVLNG